MPEKGLMIFLLGAATSFTISAAAAYTMHRRNKYLSETHMMTPETYKAIYDKKIESYREYLQSRVVYS